MPGEGKDDGGEDQTQKVKPEDMEEIKPDEKGGHPETVPWSKYVGIKESLGGKVKAAEEKVKSLEEQLGKAPNAEEHDRIKQELEDTKGKLTETSSELTKVKEQTASEMRDALTKRGVSKEKIDKMSEQDMRVALDVLGDKKPSPDFGGGGGSGELKGSPRELARQAYESSNARK